MTFAPREVLRADSIVVTFGDRRVLTAATLRAEAGEVVVLFGRNGAGKSTLLHVAAGLRPATSGAVHFQGEVYLRPSLAHLARHGMFLLPDRDLLSGNLTLRRHMSLFAARFDRPLIEQAAALVGLTERLDQRADACSGGERRLAEVALAWLRGPTCLLADEPYRDVAPIVGDTLSRVFREMADAGCAVVLSGHDSETLLGIADRVVWCTAGTTYELGDAEHARRDPRFVADYLGMRGPPLPPGRPEPPADRPLEDF
ncbi:MAG TPA: ATP-binding cassette domain-containing protein [Gemmatimonadaceae bacterium]|nr:ATP-binding cassette domain-containing protein [Gemmatimonadaceae bacterium]